jgi:hypothetical protein
MFFAQLEEENIFFIFLFYLQIESAIRIYIL